MKNYEVVIIGAGISGAAAAYELAHYTDISSVAILEKYDEVAPLNSKGTSNSQTIHVGDIETNYTLEKAAITKRTAKMVEKYCLRYNYEDEIIFSIQKMAFGVGEEEVEYLLNRYEEFSELFPYLQVWNKEDLKEIEPRVVFNADGTTRPEEIVAIGAKDQWTTVDYGKMTQSLIDNAQKEPNTIVNLFLNSQVTKIERSPKRGYIVTTANEQYYTDFVLVDAGAHSLLLAHSMGFGLDYSCLPIAGSFYITHEKMLNGKVYMIQNPKLPFAALHGDPDILMNKSTRFGPTALMLPKLERFKSGTYLDFWKTLRLDTRVISALWKLLKDSDIRNYVLKNFMFEVPWLNKYLFLKDAQKIMPSLQLHEFEYAKGFGGVRPQVIDKKTQKLLLGEASINSGEGLIFNMTPSPGATSCLGNAERDVKYICHYLGKTFDQERFNEELTEGEYCALPGPIDAQKLKANRIRQMLHEHQEIHQDVHHNAPDEDFWKQAHSKL